MCTARSLNRGRSHFCSDAFGVRNHRVVPCRRRKHCRVRRCRPLGLQGICRCGTAAAAATDAAAGGQGGSRQLGRIGRFRRLGRHRRRGGPICRGTAGWLGGRLAGRTPLAGARGPAAAAATGTCTYTVW